MLPKAPDHEAATLKLGDMNLITFDVTEDLRLPILFARIREPAVFRAFVKKTPVCKHSQPKRWNHEVRASRQLSHVTVDSPTMAKARPDRCI
jgi:hypothetical protein